MHTGDVNNDDEIIALDAQQIINESAARSVSVDDTVLYRTGFAKRTVERKLNLIHRIWRESESHVP